MVTFERAARSRTCDFSDKAPGVMVQVVPPGESEDRVQVGRVAEQVDGDNRLRPRGETPLQLLRVQGERRRIDIREYRSALEA